MVVANLWTAMGVLFNEAPSEATMAAVAPYFEAEAGNGTGKQHS